MKDWITVILVMVGFLFGPAIIISLAGAFIYLDWSYMNPLEWSSIARGVQVGYMIIVGGFLTISSLG
tara:strand:- start:1200 stop:1400 length:201 start_codon:yes stop_codon:yes gene_type:complete